MSILIVNGLSISLNEKCIISKGEFIINPGDVVLLTGPNGSGKSTIIKSIMGDLFDYGNSIRINASRLGFELNETELDLRNDEKNRELFRRNVCYISQEDEFESESVLDCFLMSLNYLDIENPLMYVFEFVKKHSIYEGFDIGANLDRRSNRIIRKLGLNTDELSEDDIRTAVFLSLSTRKMSGGQRKLTNILANLVKCEYCRLILLDEPLNNLDYNNVRFFSNILTEIHTAYPDIGIVLVTHCRSIPIINKVIEIDMDNRTLKPGETYHCNSCFGVFDCNGFYI